MPNQTPNYNLTKPLKTENYNIDVFNNNADIIDAGLKSLDLKAVDKSKIVNNLAVTESGFLLDALTVVDKFKSIDDKLYTSYFITENVDFNNIIKDGTYVINTTGTVSNSPSENKGILFQKGIIDGVKYQFFLSLTGVLYKRIYWYLNWSTWN